MPLAHHWSEASEFCRSEWVFMCRLGEKRALPEAEVSLHDPICHFRMLSFHATPSPNQQDPTHRRTWPLPSALACCKKASQSECRKYCHAWQSTDRSFRLYMSSKHSDCKITCGSYTFAAHKAVICSQSVYFDTALKNGTFKVRHPTSIFTRPPLTTDRRERPELSSLQQCRMAPTAPMYATTRRS